MPPKFLFEDYLASNGDLRASLADGDPVSAERHYHTHGRNELRAYQYLDATLSIEVAVTSLGGSVFLSGWINRKLHAEFALTIRIGHEEFEIPADRFAYYKREDVCRHLEEPDVRAAFVCMFSMGAPIRATEMSFNLGQRRGIYARTVHPLSEEAFLQVVLNRSAFVAQLPISNSYAACAFMGRALMPVWKSYVGGVSYTEVFTSQKKAPPAADRVSFVTVLYNDLTLFRLQHLLLSRVLKRPDVEWVIVLNKCDGLDGFLREAAAVDALVPFAIRVIAASSNSGFSAANNHGVSVAQSSRVALVNPDIFPNPEARIGVSALLGQPLPKNGLIGARMVYGSGALMHDGMFIADDPTYDEDARARRSLLRVEHYGKGSIAADTAKPSLRRVPAVSGAFWMIQQESFFRLGALSTDYLFAHYEDADFCLRVWEQGGQVQVFEPAVLTHLEGVGAHNSPVGISTRWINRLQFSERWGGRHKALSALSGADNNIGTAGASS
ncbi:MAG: glycosyltransferase [Alphaproteobacteria bacterium]|nr:glycosyltransferase [Alphaproteobacteria bacterium]